MRGRASGILLVNLLCAGGLLAQATPSVVFGHGANAAGAWSYAIGVLQGPTGVPTSISLVEPANSPTTPVGAWRDAIVGAMGPAGTTVLIGHSLGGIASRHATAVVPASGIMTVGAPNTGAPIAGSIPTANYMLYFAASKMTQALNLVANGAAYLWGEWLAWNVVSALDNNLWQFVDNLWGIGIGYLTYNYPADFTALVPGTAFISGLPSAQPNARAVQVTMNPGFYGGPRSLVEDPSVADQWGLQLMNVGEEIFWNAETLRENVDWESVYAWRTHAATLAAQELGFLMTQYADIWCVAVTEGAFGFGAGQCTASDGFIPVSRQGFSGATTVSLTGPAHTVQAWSPSVVDQSRIFICTVTQLCSP